jgi:hypothetical protein
MTLPLFSRADFCGANDLVQLKFIEHCQGIFVKSSSKNLHPARRHSLRIKQGGFEAQEGYTICFFSKIGVIHPHPWMALKTLKRERIVPLHCMYLRNLTGYPGLMAFLLGLLNTMKCLAVSEIDTTSSAARVAAI